MIQEIKPISLLAKEHHYHKLSEQMVQILIKKTQNPAALFFRVQVSYFLAKLSSTMRATICTHDRGDLPTNIYAINLAPSGFGKGLSTNIIEEDLLSGFKYNYEQYTLPEISNNSLITLASSRAIRNNTSQDEELEGVTKEYKSLGPALFSFSEGTAPAVKQMRHKILMSNIGAINFEMDEVGSNLIGNLDVFISFLELFDIGKIKPKLTKNTNDSKRSEDIDGRTPTNMLLFGTPAKVLNGNKEEAEFMSLLEIGYARRCLFAISELEPKDIPTDPKEILKLIANKSTDQEVQDINDYLSELANSIFYHLNIEVDEDATLAYIQYKLECEKLALSYGEHQEIQKAELSHRYFKSLKLAGVYAFIDKSHSVTKDHLLSAIKLVEECGESFNKLFSRERPHVRLAKYLASVGREVTYADLIEDLSFFPTSTPKRNEMMSLAKAWGYKNNVVIKSYIDEGIEIFSGSSLEETSLDSLIVSYSQRMADDYVFQRVKYENIVQLVALDKYNFVNHELLEEHRAEANIVEGFNMVVLDIDGTARIDQIQDILQEYTYIIYTTKSHTEESHRFRVILFTSHVLKLDKADFSIFMDNIYSWFPTEVDTMTKDRSRKWACNANAEVYTNEGILLDVLPFIPKTSKNEEYIKENASLKDLSSVERWFISRMTTGQRNVQMFKYGAMLLSGGYHISEVEEKISSLNERLKDKLSSAELESTIFKSLRRKAHE